MRDTDNIQQLILRIIRDEIRNEIKTRALSPHLAIIQVGSRHDSSAYVNMKKKAALEAGIQLTLLEMDDNSTVTQSDVQLTGLSLFLIFIISYYCECNN